MKKTHFAFITSCTCQAQIIELIFTDFFNIDRKSSVIELRTILRGYSQPYTKKEKKELTPRERQILLMRLSGMSVKIISKELNIHIKTVYAHLYSVLVKSESKSLVYFYSLALPITRIIKNMECNFSSQLE
ncbi:helix-turn-helix domain-containing protein [Vibrio sp.]|uniref:helix-turn-helix domain-containing protein n=1 Tax=Vibrio sp. TaxID=678 RepID=UPI003AA8B50E